jgi:hypothetical protein
MGELLGWGGNKIHGEQGDARGCANYSLVLSSSMCVLGLGDAETGDAEMGESFGGGGKQNHGELGIAWRWQLGSSTGAAAAWQQWWQQHVHMTIKQRSQGGGELAVATTSWLGMTATCRQHVAPTAKCWHFWLTSPCRGNTKPIPTQYFCVGDCRHSPLSS